MNNRQYNFLKSKFKSLKISGRYITVILNGIFVFPTYISFIDDIIHFMYDKDIIVMVNYRDVVGLEIRVSDEDEVEVVSGDDIISYVNGLMTSYTKY